MYPQPDGAEAAKTFMVDPYTVTDALRVGATDMDVHDTVLIAAAFCMFNRYVDGLAANTPTNISTYGEVECGKVL